MMNSDLNPGDITVCVVGLGLMGCSITTCLLMAGHRCDSTRANPFCISRRLFED